MKAVVMAGGFGTRIQPLTNSVPKPMLPVVNRPMMEHIIVKLRDELGIKDFVILLYFKPEVIKNYFKDGKDWGINIEYVLPNDDYGTAGAVKCAQEYLKNDNFIIVSGDLVTDFDFNKIIDFHKRKNSKLTITLTPVEDPLQFGVVITNQNDKIVKFLEKPGWGEVFSDTINTGIYVIEPEILDFIPKDENFDFAKDLFPLLMARGVDLWGCSIEGYWRDVGNPKSYREVHQDILHQKVKVKIPGVKVEFKNGVLYKESDISLEEEQISGIVVIGKNCKISKETKLENAVIGDEVIVKEKSEIRESVVWDNTKIGKNCKVNNSVICNDNNIGDNVQIKNGAIIAEDCDIGDNVSFERDVTVWPDKIISDNAIVSNNVVWGSKYKSSIFEEGSVKGRTNTELSCEMATKLAEALGSTLPLGSTVYVSRDYHKSSRMLKRAFLGGLLSTGINVIDITFMPSSAMRFNLANNKDIVAGVHFRQSIYSKTDTEILFFTQDGLRIDTNTAKSIERIFFRENFRRVDPEQIGTITEAKFLDKRYKEEILKHLDRDIIRAQDFKIAVDLLYGSISGIYPELLSELNLENITLNAYPDEKKLTILPTILKHSRRDLSLIVKNLGLNAGFIIYPNGQKMDIVSDSGEVLKPHIALLVMLAMINDSLKEKKKVFLPAWAPDFMDDRFNNLIIERGKYRNFTAEKLKQYLLVASVDGNFAFTEFALNRDTIFASLKMVEMMIKYGFKISSIVESMDEFYYKEDKVACPNNLKGKMMRKFLEDSQGKKSSHLDGVKIWVDDRDWILMIPDQDSDYLNLFVQAENSKKGEEILKEYKEKIEKWKIS